MPPSGQELTAGDQFSFSDDSIPSVELGCECAYGIAPGACSESVGDDGGFASGAWAPQWQCAECSNPADHDQLSSRNNFPAPKAHPMMVRHQKEMLDLLNDLPDCAYELSLKDLVDLPGTAEGEGRQDSPTTDGPTKGADSPNISLPKVGRKEREIIKGFLMRMFSSARSGAGSSSVGESDRLTEHVAKDGGKAGAAAKRTARSWKSEEKRQQRPAVLEGDHSRRPRGCCHLFQNSKNRSSRARSSVR